MKTATLMMMLLLGAHAAQAAEVEMPDANDKSTVESATPTQPIAGAPAPATLAVVHLKQTPPLRLEPQGDPVKRFLSGVRDHGGEVRGGDDAYQYHSFLPGDFASESEMTGHRQRLVDEGFEPRSGPYAKGPPTEFVVGRGDAEIWRRPKEVYNAELFDRLFSCISNKMWMQQYMRHPRGQLADELAFAAKVYHGLEKPPAGKQRPTLEQLRKLALRTVQIHPGEPKRAIGW